MRTENERENKRRPYSGSARLSPFDLVMDQHVIALLLGREGFRGTNEPETRRVITYIYAYGESCAMASMQTNNFRSL